MERKMLFLQEGYKSIKDSVVKRNQKTSISVRTCETGETSQSTRAQCVVPLT